MLSKTLLKQFEVVKHLIKSLGPDRNTPDYLEFLDNEIDQYELFIEDLKENMSAYRAVRKQIAKGTTEPRVNKLPISMKFSDEIKEMNKISQMNLTLN